MTARPEIHDDVSLRDIITAYPQTRPVMEKYGLMECGGASGPDEPLGWFARVHQVDAAQLRAELRDAIADGGTHLAQNSHADSHARNTAALDADALFKRFLVAAVAFALTGGVLWGAINLTLIAYHHRFVSWLAAGTQAHAHVQIIGWCGLFIMGIAYHVVPRLKAAPLQHVGLGYASFWLVSGGVLIHALYRPFMANAALAPIPVIAGLMVVAGAIAFAVVMVATLRRGTTAPDMSDKYLVAGTVAFVLMSIANAVLLSYMATVPTGVLPEQWSWAYYHLLLYGFVGLFIFGVSLRTLPVFLGRPLPSARMDLTVFTLLLAGIVLRAAGDVLVHYGLVSARMLLVPGAIELAAVCGFIWNLGVFKRQAASLAGMSAESRAYEKYLYAGYGWLVVATIGISALTAYRALAGHPAPHALMGSYMHALTVGFITVLILGYSMRTIPVFEGRPVYSTRILNATFVLMMIGCTMRVVFQGLTVPFGIWPFALAGISGWVEATGLALFGWNLLKTICVPEIAAVRQEEEAADMGVLSGRLTIARLLEKHPRTIDVLMDMGFEPINNPVLRHTLAKKITIETAAQMKNIPVDDLLARLQEVA